MKNPILKVYLVHFLTNTQKKIVKAKYKEVAITKRGKKYICLSDNNISHEYLKQALISLDFPLFLYEDWLNMYLSDFFRTLEEKKYKLYSLEYLFKNETEIMYTNKLTISELEKFKHKQISSYFKG